MSKIAFAFRALSDWPATLPRRAGRGSPFKADWASTIRLLSGEIEKLGATEAVIAIDVPPSQIRIDGQVRPDARVSSQRVIVSFQSKHGPLSYPCDRYSDWRANVRAIALSLEALRAVDRYGVTSRAEQYRGWQALPPPAGAWHHSMPSNGQMTVIQAAAILEQHSAVTNGPILESRENFVTASRQAAARTHPDRGGDAETFKKIQQAIEVLERHYGGGL